MENTSASCCILQLLSTTPKLPLAVTDSFICSVLITVISIPISFRDSPFIHDTQKHFPAGVSVCL